MDETSSSPRGSAIEEQLETRYTAALQLLALQGMTSIEVHLLQQGIQDLATLLEARYGAIGLVDAAGQLTHFVHTGLTSAGVEQIGAPPQGLGLLGVVLRSGESLRLERIQADPRSVGFPAGHPPMRSLLAVPIRSHRRIHGRIYLSEKRAGTPFNEVDERIARHLADALGLLLGQLESSRLEQKAVQELKESEEYHRAIMENVADSIVIVDENGHIESFNRAACVCFGYSPEEVIGMHVSQLLPPSDRSTCGVFLEDPALPSPAGTGPHKPIELNGLRKNGDLFPMNLKTTSTSLRGRKVYICMLRDSTHKKQAEQENRRITQFLDSIIENLPSMIFVKDAEELRFVRFNRAGEELLGYLRQDLIGKNDYDFFPQEEADFFTRNDRNVLAAGRLVEIPEEPIHTRENGVRILSTKKIPILDESGEPRYLLGISEDITERKKAEEALRRSEAGLAHAQRIARLGNWDWDIFTNELRWSQEIFRIFGLEPDQFGATYEAFLGAVHPEDREHVIAEVNGALYNGQAYSLDHRVVRPDGAIAIVHEQGEVIYDSDGRPLRMVGTVQDITERKVAEQRLNYLAYFDELTGLPNRVLASDRLKQAIAAARRNDAQVGIMFLDLDRFKVINDTLGHEVGDRLLKTVADRLSRAVRATDTIARLGGDEFIVIVTDITGADDAARVARKILESFQQPFSLMGRELFVSPSIGIAMFPGDGPDPESLLKHADVAMYHAKDLGKNNFQFFTERLNARASRRLTVELALRRALENGELNIHYQPQVALGSGQIVGLEALGRWSHPELGEISPMEFIPLAEETGMIDALGEWVLHAACAQQRTWRDAGLVARVAVNVSGRQLRNPNLVQCIEQVLSKSGLEPGQLEIELTESVLLDNVDGTIRTLNRLSALGLAISIDDFGTGYSSLAYLKRFPIDTLKIDRSFVRDVTADADDAAIATAIIAMAHSLGLHVIAEGVETAEQLEFLRTQGCDMIQGYFVGRPVPAEELLKWYLEFDSERIAGIRAC